MNTRALYVVAKQPAAGQTKTRLCPPLQGQEAADLYAAFLADTLAIMRCVPQVRRGKAGAYDVKERSPVVIAQNALVGQRFAGEFSACSTSGCQPALA